MTSSRLDLLPPTLDHRSGVVVDVGANVGDWTAAARLFAHGFGRDSVGEVRVKTTTLDELLADRVASLVKIDVQGAEATVLRGVRDALKRTAAVLLEVTNRSHYEDDTLFPDLHRQMADLGFELANLSRPYLDTERNPLWFDACFVRGERN